MPEWKILQLANINLPAPAPALRQIGAVGSSNQSLGQLLAGTVNSSLFDTEYSPHVKKYQIFEITEDLLALSCAWYRIRNLPAQDSTSLTIAKLIDTNLFKCLSKVDFELASKIRDYYSKKLMVLKLKSEELSEFRTDLNEFIHSDGKKFKEDAMGMVYYLPDFYFYDLKIDEIFLGRKRTTEPMKRIQTKTLTYLDTTIRNSKRNKKVEYWFIDENNTVCTVSIDHHNPLINVWSQLLNKPITLEGRFFQSRRDDRVFYTVEKYKLVNH